MEGYGGYARPLDSQILAQGWRLYAINNLKFARFKEIFPAPAKTDAIDAKRMLQLMQLREHIPMASAVLQEVAPVDPLHQQIKALTRRRKQLVAERMKISQRMQAELQGVVPGLLAITGQADNLWFLNFLTCRTDLGMLKTVRRATLLKLKGIGVGYATKIATWQKTAIFAPAIAWAGPMIYADAMRILSLREAIIQLELQIAELTAQSGIAQRLLSMPGMGSVCASELAGEIGNIERFKDEASLAVYLGVAPLDRSSGSFELFLHVHKPPHASQSFFGFSSPLINPIGRFFCGSGGVINSRMALNTCLSWARVLRAKVSCCIASASVFSSSALSCLARS
ncbi:MAG: hypothetical protein A3H99_03750 [Gallionellales bacterium RIFCSPLOWO2_02_FULL_59_110]|nr:MAG: hypothetical protein A3H99_03750 [Gallionellales bacterium RIFCSPLOWO2_02_FULL_59_110]